MWASTHCSFQTSDGFACCLTDEMKSGEEEEGQTGRLRERPLKDSSKRHIQMKKKKSTSSEKVRRPMVGGGAGVERKPVMELVAIC